MPEDRHESTSDDATLALAGLLFVKPTASGRSAIAVGPAAGWAVPRGIHQWERELSFVLRAAMTTELAAALRATLPDEQIAPKRFPMAKRAVGVSRLLAITGNLTAAIVERGIRVHTIGVDRVSGDFFYFEEGGGREPLRAQGNLVEMLAPSLAAGTTNAEIGVLMEGMLDRLLLALSEGEVSELDVELADALPRLSRDGTGLVGTNLEAFEAAASSLAARAVRWEAAARRIPEALASADRRGQSVAVVPLYGQATKETKAPLALVLGGKPLQLAAQPVWTVKGAPRVDEKPAASPTPARVADRVEPQRTPRAPPLRAVASSETRPDANRAPDAAGLPRIAAAATPVPAPAATPAAVTAPATVPMAAAPAPAPAASALAPLPTPAASAPAREVATIPPQRVANLTQSEPPHPSSRSPETPEAPPASRRRADSAASPLPVVAPAAALDPLSIPKRSNATLIVVVCALLAIVYVVYQTFR